MTPFSLRHVAVCLLLAPAGLAAQTALPKQSPFAPAAGASSTAAAANETLEFAGVSSIGKKTDVIIHDKASKRKHWIGIGETVEGISVVKYDPTREQAVVRVNGTEKVLPLRKPTRAGQGPAPVPAMPTGFNVPAPPPVVTPVPATEQPFAAPPAPAPTAPAASTTPEAQAKAETEARMLVSDLLEIGMAQRKAYEEAQRKAAGNATEQPPPMPAGQPASPPPPPGAATPAVPTTPPPGTPGAPNGG